MYNGQPSRCFSEGAMHPVCPCTSELRCLLLTLAHSRFTAYDADADLQA